MDFYEELGVARSASPEEIRHAWKRLARLFHPDVQADAELRSTAEMQMRRLNNMVEVLTDARRRRQYDLSLHPFAPPFAFAPPPPPPEQPWFHKLFHFDGKAVVWLLAGALAAGGISFLLQKDEPTIPNDAAVVETGSTAAARTQAAPAPEKMDSGSSPQPTAADQPPDSEIARSDAPPEQTPPADAPQPRPAAPAVAPDTAPRAAPVEAKKPAPDKPKAAAVVRPPRTRPVAAELRPAALSARDRPQPKGLSGLWRLRTTPRNIPAGAFAAERVEVFIRERSGQIYGTYNGKYSVPQHVASPTVAFQFAGPADSRATKMSWTSADGNSGEISLHPLSKDSLEVVWVATHITRHGILASGRAILARSN